MSEGEEEVLLALKEGGLKEGLCQQVIRDLGYDTLTVLGTLALVKEEEIRGRFDETWRFGDAAKLKLVAMKIAARLGHKGQEPALDPKQVCFALFPQSHDVAIDHSCASGAMRSILTAGIVPFRSHRTANVPN
jgi:hypothetical protein